MTSARLAPAHAVFGLRTPNLGDDLQALTVATISPYVSTLINRERIGWRQVSEPHVFVMNFWFMSGGYRWAPHETIRPIFHGFCIGRDEVLKYRWVDYLRRHQPIGCRDQHSVELLEGEGYRGVLDRVHDLVPRPLRGARSTGATQRRAVRRCAAGGGGTNSRPHQEQGRAANQHLSSLDPRRSVGSMGPHRRDLGSAALCRAGGDQAATYGIALRRLPNPARADNFQSMERLTAFLWVPGFHSLPEVRPRREGRPGLLGRHKVGRAAAGTGGTFCKAARAHEGGVRLGQRAQVACIRVPKPLPRARSSGSACAAARRAPSRAGRRRTPPSPCVRAVPG